MMAEAGWELILLVRFLDTESFDASKLASEIDEFVNRICVLFLDKACLKSGFTDHVLKLLGHIETKNKHMS